MRQETNIQKIEEMRPKALVIGAVIGAVVGLGAAYLYLQRAELDHRLPDFTTGDGVKIGLMVLGLLRSISDLGGGK